jgi:hypothetical protein
MRKLRIQINLCLKVQYGFQGAGFHKTSRHAMHFVDT